jgi:hypothetical protein
MEFQLIILEALFNLISIIRSLRDVNFIQT